MRLYASLVLPDDIDKAFGVGSGLVGLDKR